MKIEIICNSAWIEVGKATVVAVNDAGRTGLLAGA
jgi:hypothetical protein